MIDLPSLKLAFACLEVMPRCHVSRKMHAFPALQATLAATNSVAADDIRCAARGEPRANMRVLLLEDHADIAEPLLDSLRRGRYEVECAKSRDDAMRAFSANTFDLAVID